uniref:Putative ovule protein n=1 Tax=Solanum chacoense TaxID=4108 RepID=A0A0V0GWC8_SOLCH
MNRIFSQCISLTSQKLHLYIPRSVNSMYKLLYGLTTHGHLGSLSSYLYNIVFFLCTRNTSSFSNVNPFLHSWILLE